MTRYLSCPGAPVEKGLEYLFIPGHANGQGEVRMTSLLVNLCAYLYIVGICHTFCRIFWCITAWWTNSILLYVYSSLQLSRRDANHWCLHAFLKAHIWLSRHPVIWVRVSKILFVIWYVWQETRSMLFFSSTPILEARFFFRREIRTQFEHTQKKWENVKR